MTGFNGRQPPQGRLQWEIWRKVTANPQNSYPMPHGVRERAQLHAVRRMESKGLLTVEPSGRRFVIVK